MTDQASTPARSPEYVASTSDWVAEQVQLYERTNGAEGGTFRGYPVIVVTMTGARTGLIRKVPLMRVHENGTYAVLAANGGDEAHPAWYRNIISSGTVRVQDKERLMTMTVRESGGQERDVWWAKAVATYPLYEDYQAQTSRVIPVVLLEPARTSSRSWRQKQPLARTRRSGAPLGGPTRKMAQSRHNSRVADHEL